MAFYPILCQQGDERRALHFKNDGDEQLLEVIENYCADDEIAVTMQDIGDCFKLGKTINQYKQLCSDTSPTYSLSDVSEANNYDAIIYDNDYTSDDDVEIAALHMDQKDPQFVHDHSSAKEAFRHKTIDKPLLKKSINHELYPHVDTKDLIARLSDFAKEAELDVATLVEEQINDPVLQTVRKWIKTSSKPPDKTHEILQSKALLSYYNKYEELFVDEETNLLCYKEPVPESNNTRMTICLPLSLFIPLFHLAHTHSHSGHPGIFKTFENIRQHFFWPGRYKWIVYMIEDCIECQTNNSKRHDLREAPLEQWGEL